MFSLIVFPPLLSSICTGFFGYSLGTKGAAVVTLTALVVSATTSWTSFFSLNKSLTPTYISYFSWLSGGSVFIDFSFCFDELAILVAMLITTVSSLVYLYVWFYVVYFLSM